MLVRLYGAIYCALQNSNLSLHKVNHPTCREVTAETEVVLRRCWSKAWRSNRESLVKTKKTYSKDHLCRARYGRTELMNK